MSIPADTQLHVRARHEGAGGGLATTDRWRWRGARLGGTPAALRHAYWGRGAGRLGRGPSSNRELTFELAGAEKYANEGYRSCSDSGVRGWVTWYCRVGDGASRIG